MSNFDWINDVIDRQHDCLYLTLKKNVKYPVVAILDTMVDMTIRVQTVNEILVPLMENKMKKRDMTKEEYKVLIFNENSDMTEERFSEIMERYNGLSDEEFCEKLKQEDREYNNQLCLMMLNSRDGI